MSTKPPQTHLSCWLSTCKHCNEEHASVNSLNTHRQPEHQYSLYKCIYYNIMHLYHISNSSSMYCSSNPRFSFSCSSCISSGGPSGCGWCLGTHSCHTREGCEVKFWKRFSLFNKNCAGRLGQSRGSVSAWCLLQLHHSHHHPCHHFDHHSSLILHFLHHGWLFAQHKSKS